MADVHIGENGVAEVVMFDASGAQTDSYDVMSGIVYTPSDPSKLSVVDDDADPQDVRLNFLALTDPGVPVFLDVTFDGDPGDGVRQIQLRSEPINVVAGDAVAGEVRIRIEPVQPPA